MDRFRLWSAPTLARSGSARKRLQRLGGRGPGYVHLPPQGVGRPVTPSSGYMMCVSFHASKTLGFNQGGAILHDSPEADAWLRRARFDGRTEGVSPKDDTFEQLGWHCYMSPDVAAGLLLRLHSLPRHNAPLPNDDYPDLSKLPIFNGGALWDSTRS